MQTITTARTLAATEPEIAAQWHPSLNGDLTPEQMSRSSHVRAWWVCPEGHQWQALVFNRTGKMRSGCPKCKAIAASKRNAGIYRPRRRSVADEFPALVKQWHLTLNGELTAAKVTACSSKKVWWVCKKGHRWQASVKNRTNLGRGCPTCYRQPRKKAA